MTLSKGRDTLFMSGQFAKGKKGFWSLVEGGVTATLLEAAKSTSGDSSSDVETFPRRASITTILLPERSSIFDQLADVAEEELAVLEEELSSEDLPSPQELGSARESPRASPLLQTEKRPGVIDSRTQSPNPLPLASVWEHQQMINALLAQRWAALSLQQQTLLQQNLQDAEDA